MIKTAKMCEAELKSLKAETVVQTITNIAKYLSALTITEKPYEYFLKPQEIIGLFKFLHSRKMFEAEYFLSLI